MHSQTALPTERTAKALAFGILLAITLTMAAIPARADGALERSISTSSQQWRLADHMTQTTVFAALGINIVRGVDAIERMRDQFDGTMRGLRYGDADRDLVAPMSPDVVRKIEIMDTSWQRYDAHLQIVLTELRTLPQLDDTRIDELSEHHETLVGAIDDATEALRQMRSRITTVQNLENVPVIE